MNIIEVKDLKKEYQLGKNNFVKALRGASLNIEQGEMVAIMGPSGSGKSTLMHLIGCLDKPSDGEIKVADHNPKEMNRKQLAQLRNAEIGFIFQGFNLIPSLTALENVTLAAEYNGVKGKKAIDKAKSTLKLVGLADRINHLPSELSGGQQQRVAIARSLINNPKVILGDEPTGDLDTSTSAEIVEMMRKINKETNTTFVLVTHNPDVAKACDRTIYMKDGKVA